MQTDNRILDDFAKLATGAAGALQGVKNEVQQAVRQQIERILADMAVVHRDEFDAVQAMAAAARAENDSLLARIAALEARVAALEAQDEESGPAA